MREITVQVVLKLREDHPLRKSSIDAPEVESLMRSAGWLLVRDSKSESVSACVIMDRKVEEAK